MAKKVVESDKQRLNRSEAQIIRDRMEISKLYVRGYTQFEIAEMLQEITDSEYKLSRDVVQKDIQAVLKEWQNMYKSELDAFKWKEIAKLDHLETVAWDAYYESKKDKLITQENFSGGIDANTDNESEDPTKKKKKNYSPFAFSGTTKITNHGGDVRFLAEIRFIIKQRIELLGLNAPIKHDVNVKSMFDSMSDEELDRFIEEKEKEALNSQENNSSKKTKKNKK